MKKRGLTKTQVATLSVLGTEEWKTPREIAEAVVHLYLNCGAAARSLRTLMVLGKVEQKQIGWYNKKYNMGLYAYRKTEEKP